MDHDPDACDRCHPVSAGKKKNRGKYFFKNLIHFIHYSFLLAVVHDDVIHYFIWLMRIHTIVRLQTASVKNNFTTLRQKPGAAR